MLELSTVKKNKISLSDYNYRRDIENRMLMAEFSSLDVAVLEEILFSPITIQIRKLAKSVCHSEKEILPVLEKFARTGLLQIEGDSAIVDKEMRKYYELEALKFDPDFKPDMEFLQGLLRKVPINVLPIWYAIPRTSNNIFDSLIEKYLHTPQIFQRYLLELNLGDPTLSTIAQEVFLSPNFCLSSKEVIKKYALSREQFEEYVLLLEFNFMCCLTFKKVGDDWNEVITPFNEWQEYLTFLRETAPQPVSNPSKVERKTPHDFSFVQEISSVLQAAKKGVVSTPLSKIALLKLGEIQNGKLYPTEAADEWLEMRLENRALYLYRHPLNRICSTPLPPHLQQEKVIRDAEKAILRVLQSGWVIFDEFIKGVSVPLNDHSVVTLKKTGKAWHYVLPKYTPEEEALIKATIFEWLFEVGVTAVGTYEGKDCFCVTPFGQSLYG